LEYLLFVVYLILFAWLVTRIGFFNRSGLSKPQLIILFLLKVMAGIFYGWIGLYYGGLAQMSDTWGFHAFGVQEHNLLVNDPKEYLTNLFRNSYEGGSGFETLFRGGESYWNDLKGNAFIKVLSIFNIFSFGYYYVNVIFCCFVTMFGPMAIYKVMTDVFPGRKFPIALATFLIPSFLYWTSGIHKDGLIFVGISLVVYHVYFGLKQKKWNIKRISGILLGLLLLLTLRNFLIVVIVPAIFIWILAWLWPRRALAVFTSVYLVFIILFFTVRYINPALDFPQAVVNKQQEFISLQGNSSIPITKLQPTAISFLENIPQAFTLATIRPYPGDVRHILTLAAATEVILLLLLFSAFLLFRRKDTHPSSAIFIYFCLFFSFSVLLAIGYSVNNLGAIVRYRSVIIPLLVVPMVALTDWSRLSALFFSNIKNRNNI
jgi:hypothetical protein